MGNLNDHELLVQFEKMYLPLGDKPKASFLIEQEFVASLAFQTKLLDIITSFHEVIYNSDILRYEAVF